MNRCAVRSLPSVHQLRDGNTRLFGARGGREVEDRGVLACVDSENALGLACGGWLTGRLLLSGAQGSIFAPLQVNTFLNGICAIVCCPMRGHLSNYLAAR